jgi:hypothetical protein
VTRYTLGPDDVGSFALPDVLIGPVGCVVHPQARVIVAPGETQQKMNGSLFDH